jgi:hypothetical protein
MVRLRRANPVPQAPAGDHSDLFARITASPGDPRLTEAAPRRPLLQRGRAIVLMLALGLAALLASTAFAISQWNRGRRRSAARDEPGVPRRAEAVDPAPGGRLAEVQHAGLNTLTSRGGGGGTAVLIAQNAWECYWARAIRNGDRAGGARAQAELNKLLADNILVAPIRAPEVGFRRLCRRFSSRSSRTTADGGLNWVRASYKQAAAGDPRNLIASCRANAPS